MHIVKAAVPDNICCFAVQGDQEGVHDHCSEQGADDRSVQGAAVPGSGLCAADQQDGPGHSARWHGPSGAAFPAGQHPRQHSAGTRLLLMRLCPPDISMVMDCFDAEVAG